MLLSSRATLRGLRAAPRRPSCTPAPALHHGARTPALRVVPRSHQEGKDPESEPGPLGRVPRSVWSVLEGMAVTLVVLTGPMSPAANGTDDLMQTQGGQQPFNLVEFALWWVIVFCLYKVVMWTFREGTTPHQDQGQSSKGAPEVHDADDPKNWTSAHVRSYKDPASTGLDMNDLRNRALSTSAAFHIATTVRECQPRIRALIAEITATSPGRLTRPHMADVDPVAATTWEYLSRLEPRWAAMSQAEHEAHELRITEMVAERAALTEIEALIKVVHDDEDKHMQPPNTLRGA